MRSITYRNKYSPFLCFLIISLIHIFKSFLICELVTIGNNLLILTKPLEQVNAAVVNASFMELSVQMVFVKFPRYFL